MKFSAFFWNRNESFSLPRHSSQKELVSKLEAKRVDVPFSLSRKWVVRPHDERLVVTFNAFNLLSFLPIITADFEENSISRSMYYGKLARIFQQFSFCVCAAWLAAFVLIFLRWGFAPDGMMPANINGSETSISVLWMVPFLILFLLVMVVVPMFMMRQVWNYTRDQFIEAVRAS